MGLLKNLRLLFNDDLIARMLSLERRQELLEDYTDQKLDMMKSYSARVNKRERDAAATVPTSIPFPTMGASRADQKRALRNGHGR